MPVRPGLIFFDSISRFSTPAVTPMAAMAEKMQANERDPDKDPNPVLCKPSHFSLPLRNYGSFRTQIICMPTFIASAHRHRVHRKEVDSPCAMHPAVGV